MNNKKPQHCVEGSPDSAGITSVMTCKMCSAIYEKYVHADDDAFLLYRCEVPVPDGALHP